MPGTTPESENQESSSTNESIHERGNHIIVSAAGGVLVGAALASIGWPALVTGAVVGAIAGAAIGSSFNGTQDVDKEVTEDNENSK